MNSIEEVYYKYHNLVNMSYSELLEWSKTECSKKASLSREPINRNLRLLKKRKSEWNSSDIPKANKTISYLSRAKKIKSTKEICGGYTKNEIALKNWGYDVSP
jgi:hypothetical protein